MKKFEKIMKDVEELDLQFDPQPEILNSVAYGFHIKPINENYNEVKWDNKMFLTEIIDRQKNIKSFTKILKDITKSLYLEAGIFEFTLEYGMINNINQEILPSIYQDKFIEIKNHIDKKSHLFCKKTYELISKNRSVLQKIAFFKPHELNEDIWLDIIKRHAKRDYYKENIASTDLYKCRNCGERKTQAVQVQTRSCDEPMTIFITCLVCKNRWKKF